MRLTFLQIGYLYFVKCIHVFCLLVYYEFRLLSIYVNTLNITDAKPLGVTNERAFEKYQTFRNWFFFFFNFLWSTVALQGPDSWLINWLLPLPASLLCKVQPAVLVIKEDGRMLLQLSVSLTQVLRLGSLSCGCLGFWEGHSNPLLYRKSHILSQVQSGHCASFTRHPDAGSADLPTVPTRSCCGQASLLSAFALHAILPSLLRKGMKS